MVGSVERCLFRLRLLGRLTWHCRLILPSPLPMPPKVEALAQLQCLDALSAPLVIRLAVGAARRLEEGQPLAVGQLNQLARVMQSLSVAAGKGGRGQGAWPVFLPAHVGSIGATHC